MNRVGDKFLNQMTRNGHDRRVSDLDLFASLGIRALRYPVLWELLQPEPSQEIDWSWTDERLHRLRELGIRPIAGLLHHGSGPSYTNMVDPAFAPGLARFARKVAERYPWLQDYTPVNEPLTTARFSCLYGHWYPHTRDHRSFARAIVNECRAVALSMAAIREVNPGAQLVQTEDLGRTYSTEVLAPLADHLNSRRWITFDLLGGRVRQGHPMWVYLRSCGIPEAELMEFVEQPCPPDVVGVNHYLTSDRFLDHELSGYPESVHSKELEPVHANVEAVRVCPDCYVGAAGVLREAWQRYGSDVAVTEAHLGCTREEQIRWLAEVADGARKLCQEGVPVRAVTTWSLLGAFNWNTLVTRDGDFYEPGVFDLRAARPRPTALARVVRKFAAGEPLHEPVLDAPGWWRRAERISYPHASGRSHTQPPTEPQDDMSDRSPRPLLIVGATGTLGRAFARLCDVRGIPYHLVSRHEVNLLDPKSVDAALDELSPWAVVNAAGYVRIDDAETDEEQCYRTNCSGVALLAAACARHAAPLLAFSSDMVFDGEASRDYVESDSPGPINAYGRSKANMEQRVQDILPSALIVRTAAFFGPWDQHNFVSRGLQALAAGKSWVVAEDVTVSPTYIVDLVHACLDLLIDRESGLWHLANRGSLTWAELARRAAALSGLPQRLVQGRPAASLQWFAARPRHSALVSERGWVMPEIDDALQRYWAEFASGSNAGAALKAASNVRFIRSRDAA
ncbi:MAG TPA: family 1 glycosylhydrolase [Bryobacteraceae bacterium]|nr:family 1 glycosylhydrolase [Bryobacteraceae bacterium]